VSTTLLNCTSPKELLQNDFVSNLNQTLFFEILFLWVVHRSWLTVSADQEGRHAVKATEIIDNHDIDVM